MNLDAILKSDLPIAEQFAGWSWGNLTGGWYCTAYPSKYEPCHKSAILMHPNGQALCKACVEKIPELAMVIPDDIAELCNGGPGRPVKETLMPTNKIIVCYGCKQKLCNVCAVCHTDECSFNGFKIITANAATAKSYLKAKTQKIRGFIALKDHGFAVPNPFKVITSNEDIEAVAEALAGTTMFVRPCPIRPRHGFVDSRPMDFKVGSSSREDLQKLFDEARAADDANAAELLITPYVESKLNLIITPTRIAVGAGNDGATSGHGSIGIPLMGVPFPELTEKLLQASKVDINVEDPYIEAVVNQANQLYFTQLRAGVKIPPAVKNDYLPEPMRVEAVIDASGDLLEWETQTKSIRRGTVVCHLGGTLISHYGVHCLSNRVACFTSRRPEIGEVLDQVTKLDSLDPAAVIQGLGDGALFPLTTSKMTGTIAVHDALDMMMSTLHNANAMTGKDAYWVGFAVSIMMRAGMAASHGEARHKYNKSLGRSTVYKMALKDFIATRKTLGSAQWAFTKLSWGNGFGGKAWANCTKSIFKLDSAARTLMNDPSEDKVAQLIVALNNAVNQAHNGGWWLNKFTQQSNFTNAANQSIHSVAKMATMMFEMRQMMGNSKLNSAELIDQWKAATEIEVAASVGTIHPDAALEGTLTAKAKKQGEKLPSSKAIDTKLKNYHVTDVELPFGWGLPPTSNGLGLLVITCPCCWSQYKTLDWSYASGEQKCGKPLCGDTKVALWTGEKFVYVKPKTEEELAAEPKTAEEMIAELGDPDDNPFDDDEEYEETSPPSTISVNTNIGDMGIKVSPEAQVTEAQFTVPQDGAIHCQLKTNESIGYYSFNAGTPWVYKNSVAGMDFIETFSGSSNDTYLPFKIEQLPDNGWGLVNEALNIRMLISMKNGYPTVTTVGKYNEGVMKNGPTTQQIETQPSAEVAPEIPF